MGRQFFGYLASPSDLDRKGVHGPHRVLQGTTEHQEAPPLFHHPEIHWFQLGPGAQICCPTKGEITSNIATHKGVAVSRHILFSMRSCQPPQKISTHLLHLPSHPTLPLLNLTFYRKLYLPLSQTACSVISPKQPILNSFPSAPPPK